MVQLSVLSSSKGIQRIKVAEQFFYSIDTIFNILLFFLYIAVDLEEYADPMRV